jgi:hypothetical protein
MTPSNGNGKDARPVPLHKQLSTKEQSTLGQIMLVILKDQVQQQRYRARFVIWLCCWS